MRNNRYAKVVDVHPEAFAVDLLFLDNNERAAMVQVLAPAASTTGGLMEMIQPDGPKGDAKYTSKETNTGDVYALVGYAGTAPIVLGFLYPQVCQMLFKDMGLRVERHAASDVYSTLDKDGNSEWYHPSGTYFRVAVDTPHKDLTGLDFDKKWKITKNTDKQLHVHFELWTAGVKKASFELDPSGNVTMTNAGTLSSTTAGNVTAKSTSGNILVEATAGDITLKASGTVTVDAPNAHFTGDVQVDKTLTATTDVVGGGKHLKTHLHSGVTAGAANTGAPV